MIRKNPKSLICVLTLTLGALSASPVLAQNESTYAIRGATIHTLAGPAIENGTVVIRNGRITAVGADVNIPRRAQVIDATGLEVYPGFLDAATQLGLTEVDSVAATVDNNELGRYNPQLETYRAIHPSSEHIPVTRANGTTHALSIPGNAGGGFGDSFSSGTMGIPGQAALIHLDGWTVEEMAAKRSAVMVVQWPSLNTRSFDFSTFSFRSRPFKEAEKEYKEQVAELEEWFEASRHYKQATESASAGEVERNRKLESLLPVLSGELPVLIMTGRKRTMTDAIAFAEKQQIRLILGGASEAWKMKDLLKEKDIPLILGGTQHLPFHEDAPYDRPYSLPGELRAAGIRFAIASFESAHARTLPYEAGNAVPYGLDREEALKAITLYPAQILGVDDQLGTIEEGKIANLIVTNGDPLEISTEIRYVFIQGRNVDTDNKHRRLFEKYRARP